MVVVVVTVMAVVVTVILASLLSFRTAAASSASHAGAGRGGGSSSGGQTPGSSGGQTPGGGISSRRRVTFAEELVAHAELMEELMEDTRKTEVEGTMEPHLPGSKSLSSFLEVLGEASVEAESQVVGIRSWANDLMDDLSIGYPGFRVEKQYPENWFLGVCVVCPPWATQSTAVSLPLLLAQLLPHLGRARVHLLLPVGQTTGCPAGHAEGLLVWVMAKLEFALRLQLLRVYTADGGEVWHDAVWRNVVSRAALADGATTLMHVSTEQLLGVDWFKAICAGPWRLGTPGGQTPGGESPGVGVVSSVLQDEGEDEAATVVVTASIWRRLGGFDEEFALLYLPDVVARLRMAGLVSFVNNRDAAGSQFPDGQDPAQAWAAQLQSLPMAYRDQTEAAVRSRIRDLSKERVAAGKAIRNDGGQTPSPMWAPAVRAQIVLLQHEVNVLEDIAIVPEKETDWGDVDVDEVSAMAMKGAGADLVAAASSWKPEAAAAEAAAAEAAAPASLGGTPAAERKPSLRTCKQKDSETSKSKPYQYCFPVKE